MVIADGLNNPRGLEIGGSGAIFVAEAGTGGSGPCQMGPNGEESCFGLTGSVTRINTAGKVKRVITGLPSHAAPDGSAAIGISDIAMHPHGAKFG